MSIRARAWALLFQTGRYLLLQEVILCICRSCHPLEERTSVPLAPPTLGLACATLLLGKNLGQVPGPSASLPVMEVASWSWLLSLRHKQPKRKSLRSERKAFSHGVERSPNTISLQVFFAFYSLGLFSCDIYTKGLRWGTGGQEPRELAVLPAPHPCFLGYALAPCTGICPSSLLGPIAACEGVVVWVGAGLLLRRCHQ